MLLTLSALLAVIWLVFDAGWLEPVTLIVAAIASILTLWLSHVIPPISQLSEEEIRELIATSSPHEDWARSQISGRDVMT